MKYEMKTGRQIYVMLKKKYRHRRTTTIGHLWGQSGMNSSKDHILMKTHGHESRKNELQKRNGRC